jgi:hypothetical protein
MVNFTTTGRAAKDQGVKVLVYGKSGMGKTYLSSTASDNFIISCESGLLSLRDFDIPAAEITSFAELNEAYRWVAESNDAKQFNTFTLDSVTEIGEIALSYLKSIHRDPRQAYGELVDKVLSVVKKFRDLKGKNVYFTAKEARFKDESTGSLLYGPEMPGQRLGPGLPYYFDEVFRIETATTDNGTKYRLLRTQPDEQYDAKDRSGALDEIERPHLDHVFNKIKAGVKSS